MSNIVARSFFKDDNISSLENSEGVRNVVNKKRRIEEVKAIIIDLRVSLECNFKSLSEINQSILEIESAGFFEKLFNKKNLEAQKEFLIEQRHLVNQAIDEIKSKIEIFSNEKIRLEQELSQYATELAKISLTIEDILNEYNLIKQELKQRELAKTSSNQGNIQSEKQTKISQVDRFNLKRAKHMQMCSGKQQ